MGGAENNIRPPTCQPLSLRRQRSRITLPPEIAENTIGNTDSNRGT